MNKELQAFQRLLNIMNELREKCPWDKKQTLESLRKLTIEETYELSDAILENDLAGIKEELGDLFLHLVFYTTIGKEKGTFDVASVLNGICEKLINRHPHIYGDTEVSSEEEVLKNWEKIKLKEGKKSILQGVPNSLPAIIKAYRMQEKTSKVGFEWAHKEDVWKKVREELKEFEQAVEKQDKKEAEKEFGDILFSLINYARYINIDPEAGLQRTNVKFKKRFEYIEEQAAILNKDLHNMSLEEMDILWNEAKAKIRSC